MPFNPPSADLPLKPVRLPASATLMLPRWGLILLCLMYILPGLIGRDPWKYDDAASFGVMWTMAHGGLSDWLWPNIVGEPMAQEGPFAFWLGAICIKLFGWILGDALAARIAPLSFFFLDAEEEATDTIDRAISNYTQLLGKLPLRHLPAIDDFERARRVKINS